MEFVDPIITVFAVIGFFAVLSLVIRLLTEAIVDLINKVVECICEIKKAYLKAQRKLKPINNPGKKKRGKGVRKKPKAEKEHQERLREGEMWYRVDLNYYCEECKKNISDYGFYEKEEAPEEVRKMLTDYAAYLHHQYNHVFCWNCKRQIKPGEPAIPIHVKGELKYLCQECEPEN